ncbi:hypothetical protein U1Q18_052341 [Sarracenia purpurea var. burkii]
MALRTAEKADDARAAEGATDAEATRGGDASRRPMPDATPELKPPRMLEMSPPPRPAFRSTAVMLRPKMDVKPRRLRLIPSTPRSALRPALRTPSPRAVDPRPHVRTRAPAKAEVAVHAAHTTLRAALAVLHTPVQELRPRTQVRPHPARVAQKCRSGRGSSGQSGASELADEDLALALGEVGRLDDVAQLPLGRLVVQGL